jgi:hypothetical protein
MKAETMSDQINTIFEYLTAKNPDVRHFEPKSKTNTSSVKYHCPTQLKKWDEFEFEVFEKIYDNRLFRESHRERSTLPQLPKMLKDDLEIYDEDATKFVMNTWNRYIVNHALEEIKDSFYPARWHQGKSCKNSESPPQEKTKTRQIPRRASSSKLAAVGTKRRRPLRPDAGAVPLWPSSEPRASSPVDFLPKDFKAASKWDSSKISDGKLIDQSGFWRQGTRKMNAAMPIRQIYTYCINSGCRYGCILTAYEVLIVRVRPREELGTFESRHNFDGPELTFPCALLLEDRNIDMLRQCLIDDGLLEYASIPWAKHRTEDDLEYRDWTVNLALWFVHILAGNSHQVGWSYGPLIAEKLRTPIAGVSSSHQVDIREESAHEIHMSTDRRSGIPSDMFKENTKDKGNKRGRVETEDYIHPSFNEKSHIASFVGPDMLFYFSAAMADGYD